MLIKKRMALLCYVACFNIEESLFSGIGKWWRKVDKYLHRLYSSDDLYPLYFLGFRVKAKASCKGFRSKSPYLD